MGQKWSLATLKSGWELSQNPFKKGNTDMYASKLKPAAATALALSALLALGACGKKVDDATKAPSSPEPMTSPSTAPGSMGSTSSSAGAMSGSTTTGTDTMGSGVTPPATTSSGARN